MINMRDVTVNDDTQDHGRGSTFSVRKPFILHTIKIFTCIYIYIYIAVRLMYSINIRTCAFKFANEV
jgi:hypothetical protein